MIYGLPHRTSESIKTTIDTVLSLDPDRLALYHYAHLPHVFKPQRRIDTASVPDSEEKLDMLQYCVQTLTERGYVFIGMDHFAKPDDELSIALKEGFLQRNFQGYSTYADCDLVAIGVSSIGKIGSTYSQNERDIDAYYAAIDEAQTAHHARLSAQSGRHPAPQYHSGFDVPLRARLPDLRKYVRHPVRPLLQRRTGGFGKTHAVWDWCA